MFWSSQLHACCMRDTLQNFKDASYLNQSLNVVEKLLPQVEFSCRKPTAIWLHTWHFYHNHASRELLQGQMCRIKESPTSPEMM